MVAVFAHPDDEAFGPGGTIVKLSKDHEITVICVTPGDAGQNIETGDTRKKELLESAKILGVNNVIFLDYKDGTLSNSIYHQLAADIERELEKIKPEILMTFDIKGVSGHIDHIAVSLISTYVFYRLPFIMKLLYYCVDRRRSDLSKDYFIYFPNGYDVPDIDLIVDVSDVWERKVTAMMAHTSQRADAERILARVVHLPKEECFLVLRK